MNLISRSGPTQNEPAGVLAVHCSASGPRQWDGYRALLDPGVRMIAPHLVGYEGRDEWTNGARVTLEQEALQVLAALDAREEPVHLVGHSYGGAVAMQAALLAPQRVRSLTVYEPGLFSVLQQDARSVTHAEEIGGISRRIALLSLSGRKFEAAEIFVDYWSGRGAWSRMDAVRQASVAHCMSKVRAEFEASFHARLRVRGIDACGFPVRVLCGERSPAPARRIVQLLMRQCPGAEVIRVSGAAHMAPLAQRELLAPLLFPHSVPRELRLVA
jgi:pimeloyl-ACP methyl ester carboxylesterase